MRLMQWTSDVCSEFWVLIVHMCSQSWQWCVTVCVFLSTVPSLHLSLSVRSGSWSMPSKWVGSSHADPRKPPHSTMTCGQRRTPTASWDATKCTSQHPSWSFLVTKSHTTLLQNTWCQRKRCVFKKMFTYICQMSLFTHPYVTHDIIFYVVLKKKIKHHKSHPVSLSLEQHV